MTNSVYMSEDERQQAIQLLEETRDKFLSLTRDLSQPQWTAAPQPDAWSVALVAEHLILAEIGSGKIVQRCLAAEPDPNWQEGTAGKIELLERVMPMRRRRATAPEVVYPQGRIAVPELRSRFRKFRQRTLDFVASADKPLKQHTADHPFFGLLNGYQWLVCIALHNLRHNLQIVEILEQVGE